ncbi:MAG: hypothetical protein HY259_01640 [Chloroflexi bacterium]|nr:hypothetical protein [Chloroflexota bacterium]MBI3732145.1 hypothetical protein [Chloroflexota bacterium]
MKPVMIEVVAYAPTGFYHCTHCEIIFKEQGIGDKIHSEQLQSAIPEDLMRDYAQVSRWVNAMVDRYGAQVAIQVIDAASIEGFWKSLRHGLRRYPAVVVGGRDKYSLADASALESGIARRVSAVPAA